MSKIGQWVLEQQNEEFFGGFDRVQSEKSQLIESESAKRFQITVTKPDSSFMSYQAIGRQSELLNSIYDTHEVCGVSIRLLGNQ